MKTEETKSLPIAESTHFKVKLLAAQRKTEMKVIIDQAIDAFAAAEPIERQASPIAGPGPQVLSKLDRDIAVIQKRDPRAAEGIRRLISMAARGIDDATIGADAAAPKAKLQRATARAGRTLDRATGSADDDATDSAGVA